MTTVLVERVRAEVLQITLNRRGALNALNREMVRDLAAALDQVERDTTCRVVILTGAGRGFCAGFDLNGYGDEEELETAGATRGLVSRQDEISAVALRLHQLRQPVIAALNGATAGAGLSLAAGADIRLAATDAVFSAAYLRAGFTGTDLGSSWLLPRLVGAGRAHELVLTARRFDAEEALRIGLVTNVVPSEGLLDAALRTAEQILLAPPLSVELTKRGLWTSLETPSLGAAVELENRLLVLSALTEDQPEAVRAFLEKRPPQYRNR